MKNMTFLIAVALSCMILVSPARAFYLQTAPYPSVLGPALELLPAGTITIVVDDETFYYNKGIFYQKIIRDQRYAIVPPPIGAVVYSIPQGYEYILNEDGTPYYVYGGVYYKRTLEGFRVVDPPV